METILCQYLEYPFHWKRFFYLSEIYFKRILYYSQWQRIFFLVETIFFHSLLFFGNHSASRGSPKFLKHLVSARRNRFLFFQALIWMEVAFRSSEIAFFRKSFVLASGNGFLINCKIYVFIRCFSLLVDTILQIRCKPIFFHFFIPNLTAEAVFPASRNELFIECFIPAPGNAFFA